MMRSLFSHFQATRADQENEQREAEYRAGRLARVIGRHRIDMARPPQPLVSRSPLTILELEEELLEPLYAPSVYVAPLPEEAER